MINAVVSILIMAVSLWSAYIAGVASALSRADKKYKISVISRSLIAVTFALFALWYRNASSF